MLSIFSGYERKAEERYTYTNVSRRRRKVRASGKAGRLTHFPRPAPLSPRALLSEENRENLIFPRGLARPELHALNGRAVVGPEGNVPDDRTEENELIGRSPEDGKRIARSGRVFVSFQTQSLLSRAT